MPPYRVFALDNWIQQYARKCRVSLHDSMVAPLTLKELQAFDPEHKIISETAPLTYSAARGTVGLKENISLLYDSLDGTTKFDPENILVTSGAISANKIVLETLLTPGDRVIVQHATFGQLVEIPRRVGADVTLWRQIQRPADKDGFPTFGFDIDDLVTKLDKIKPRLLIVNNPSNPTGALLTKDQLERIVQLCSERDVLILCDEVFRFLHHDDKIPMPPSILQLNPKNCIVVSSISKSFALPGARVGWIAISSDLRDTLFKQFCVSNDYSSISIGCIDQDIAEFALRPSIRTQILQRSKDLCRQNIDVISQWAMKNKDRVTFFRPLGAGSCVVRLKYNGHPIDDIGFVKKLVEKEGVFAPPAGTCFGDQADGSGHTEMRGFLRISLGMDMSKLKIGLSAIERVCEHWMENEVVEIA